MKSRMKVVDLNLNGVQNMQSNVFKNQHQRTCRLSKSNGGFSSVLCHEILKVVKKYHNKPKVQEIRACISSQNIVHLIKIIEFYLDHSKNCNEQKMNEKIITMNKVYEEELTRKQKKNIQLENIANNFLQIITTHKEQMQKKQNKIWELESQIHQFSNKAKKKALTELNEQSQTLLKRFKINSTSIETPEDIQFKHKAFPLQRSKLGKKPFFKNYKKQNKAPQEHFFIRSNTCGLQLQSSEGFRKKKKSSKTYECEVSQEKQNINFRLKDINTGWENND